MAQGMQPKSADSTIGLKARPLTGYCRNSSAAQALAASLLPDPDRLFANGEPVSSAWRSTATDKARIRLAGQDYFVKRYNCQGAGYRVKNLLRPSRALRSWTNGLRFQQAQVPTVLPVLCLEERFWGLLGRSWVVFPYLSDAESLLGVWPALAGPAQEETLFTLAEIFGRMHRQGIFHGDLNWRNILVQRNREGLQYLLIDLDACHYRSRYRAQCAHADLKHFYRDMQRAAVAAVLSDEFQKIWRTTAMA